MFEMAAASSLKGPASGSRAPLTTVVSTSQPETPRRTPRTRSSGNPLGMSRLGQMITPSESLSASVLNGPGARGGGRRASSRPR